MDDGRLGGDDFLMKIEEKKTRVNFISFFGNTGGGGGEK